MAKLELKVLLDIERRIGAIEHILRRRLPPAPSAHVSLAVGSKEIEMTSFNLKPGETKTLTAAYTDDNGKTDPLGQVPVASCSDADITLTPIGTFTVNDPQFQWTIAASANATPGDFEVDVDAKGDQAGNDDIPGKILGTVPAPEDTRVALSVA